MEFLAEVVGGFVLGVIRELFGGIRRRLWGEDEADYD